ncbi:hypothetical protein KM043_018485 [Ampulex compressa]|nr:hypothetical protein KM043_018485 [Ampulex compressa]
MFAHNDFPKFIHKGAFACIALILLAALEEYHCTYVPPNVLVEPLQPKGLRMSIPHEDGITLVAFHVKFNEDFDGLEAGTIARDIVKSRDGRWTYQDRTTRLKRNDIIYYWIHVVYDGLGYNLLDQQYRVLDFFDYSGEPIRPPAPTDGQSCAQPSETKVIEKNGDQRNTCPGQLLFEENFDSLDPTRWTTVERFSTAPDYEFVIYMNNNENVYVRDGILHIIPTFTEAKHGDGFARTGTINLEKCTSSAGEQSCRREAVGSYILPPVISGRVNTKQSFKFLYGRVEVRAKLPQGDWIYPMISLENSVAQNGNAYNEIRIASARGNAVLKTGDNSDLSGHILYAGGVKNTVNQDQVQFSNRFNIPRRLATVPWSNDYHVYEIEWRSNRIIARVDGLQYGEQVISASFDTPSYINIGLAVGGRTEFPDGCMSKDYEKPWRNVGSKALFTFYQDRDKWMPSWTGSDTGLHVDYVKVWAA